MANRYWRNVGGTWDGTAGLKWASTLGGGGGASVPTSADDVFFTNATNCVISAGNTGAKSITCTGYTGTLSGSSAITVSGSVTLVAGMTYTYTGTLTINASSTITSAGKTFGNLTISALGSTVTLADALTVGAGSSTVLTAGTIDLAGFTLSTGVFNSDGYGGARAVAFGSGNIALTSTTAATIVLRLAGAGNFTWTGTGGFTRNMAAGATVQFGTGGTGTVSNAPNLTVNAGASALTITNGSFFKDVVFTGSTSTVSGGYNASGNLTLASGGTYTSLSPAFRASGTVTSTGKTISSVTVNASGGTVTLADAMTLGINSTFGFTAGTIDLAGFNLNTGVFVSSNTNTRSITFGSGNIALTNNASGGTVLSMANATGFTWTGTGGFTRNQVASATVTFGTTGGTVSNAPNFSVNAGGPFNLTITSNSYLKNLNFTGSTVTASGVYNACGDLTLASGAGAGAYTTLDPTFCASATLTSAAKTLGNATVNGAGITVTLADAFVASGALTLTEGTFANPSNFNVTAFNFLSNSGNACSLSLGSSTWTITGGDATTSWVATNASLTFNAGTSTINLTYVGVKEFFAGNRTYYNVNVGGTGDFYIYGTNTFNNITNSVQPATVIFESGLTQTVSNFGLSGTAGNLITISSDAAGFQFTLSKASGTVNAQYLSIQDSVATGGAVWNSLTSNGNVDAGNNTGWIFGSAATGNMFLMFI